VLRNLSILLLAAVVIALPFVFRQEASHSDWRAGDPTLVIITPHNEAIRFEFAHAFSRWHQQRYGKPVLVDWRAIGGTSEISRYLTAEFVSAARGWWISQNRPWPTGAGEALVDRKFDTKNPPTNQAAVARWENLRDLYTTFRATDDAQVFTARIDLFFGGGDYDHNKAFGEGLTVPPWPTIALPAGLFTADDGTELIPAKIGGETWRTATFFGTAVSTFGICYNLDRLHELGITEPPSQWSDLGDARYFRQLGLADPTKSGSFAKAFELIIHQQCYDAVRAAGFSDEDIDRHEKAIAAAKLPPGALPDGVPTAYQSALEHGWEQGIRLVQRIGANARYFTDSASKAPIDVSAGNAAAGLAIDFYGRFQAQSSRAADGRERMNYITPRGGSGASCDPISLLRGAPHRETAVRFIEFVLSEEGQKLWTYRPGTPGGPLKFALRRVPIRRTFFPSDNPAMQRAHEEHLRHAADNLADPLINPYELARTFIYRPRWTGQHFGIQRDIVRAMCLNASTELQAAWTAIAAHNDPAQRAAALEQLARLPDQPEPLNWRSALRLGKPGDRLDTLRDWTLFYRTSYGKALEMLTTHEHP
jgi:ABC-type Fe3+ transport system substrate-binding protein